MSKRILLVAYYLPSRGHGGGLRLLDLYGLIRRAFPGVRLDLAACRHSPEENAGPDLAEIFDDIHVFDPGSFNPDGFRSAGVLGEQYDVVDLQYLQAGRFIRTFRRGGVDLVIFSPMESMIRAAGIALRDLWRPFSLAKLAGIHRHLGYAAREAVSALRADRVLCVSKMDASTLRMFRRRGGVFPVETGVSPLEFPDSLEAGGPIRELDGTRRVVFVAFFGSATNRDALAWYLQEVHPAVVAAVPGYCLEVVGRGLDGPTLVVDGNVKIVGEVDSIEAQQKGAWIGIAPALSGAGLRGKINQYAIAGLPCVASSLAAEGLAYRDGESICLASDAAAFARQCIKLLLSRQFNMEVGRAARQVCLANYMWEAKTDQVARVYGLETLTRT